MGGGSWSLVPPLTGVASRRPGHRRAPEAPPRWVRIRHPSARHAWVAKAWWMVYTAALKFAGQRALARLLLGVKVVGLGQLAGWRREVREIQAVTRR